ncbi:hypothetical protein QC764_0050380 [Podospora pseudoanserina]|uniref:Uncharacterized protein n=1 Tax=Podospora pseudoanserina TaxID=2609844 RepID=A0ABR0IC27_9PEZI|nr:hypothetical protein QC764_0050380 [Podospora pseudoanserina]
MELYAVHRRRKTSTIGEIPLYLRLIEDKTTCQIQALASFSAVAEPLSLSLSSSLDTATREFLKVRALHLVMFLCVC